MDKRRSLYLLAFLLFPLVRVLVQWFYVDKGEFPPNWISPVKVCFVLGILVFPLLWYLRTSWMRKAALGLVAVTLGGVCGFAWEARDAIATRWGWGGFFNLMPWVFPAWLITAVFIAALIALAEAKPRGLVQATNG